jgi:copper homeostasis protein
VSPRLEVCVDTPDGLDVAVEAGADRIELCAALALSGLTPSPGLMRAAGRYACPIYVMIRPRAGDFVFNRRDLDVMRADIDAVRAAGLAGVVLGASKADGALDEDALAILVDHAAGLGKTLHRAFDLAPSLFDALDIAIGLGFERILTSGGAPTAVEGASMLADLTTAAAGRISIMAGSGIDPTNVSDLVHRTGVSEVHASCSTLAPSPATPDRAHALGFAPDRAKHTDAKRIAEVLEKLGRR